MSALQLINNRTVRATRRRLIRQENRTTSGDEFEYGGYFYQNSRDPNDLIFIPSIAHKAGDAYEQKPPCDDSIIRNGKKYNRFANVHLHNNNPNFVQPSDEDYMPPVLGGQTKPMIIFGMGNNAAVIMKQGERASQFITNDRGTTFIPY